MMATECNFDFFSNQARAGHKLVRAWFLKIDPVQIVSMRVRVSASGGY